MSTIVKPYTFVNGQTADGPQVNANFDTLYTAANAVKGEYFTALSTIPAGAGVIPAANLPAAGGVATELSFVNGDLAGGVLTVTHGKALSSAYSVIVQIINNSSAVIIPDAINTFATNSFKVDLTSYGALTGTWYCIYLTK